jgi:hypothetical protein
MIDPVDQQDVDTAPGQSTRRRDASEPSSNNDDKRPPPTPLHRYFSPAAAAFAPPIPSYFDMAGRLLKMPTGTRTSSRSAISIYLCSGGSLKPAAIAIRTSEARTTAYAASYADEAVDGFPIWSIAWSLDRGRSAGQQHQRQ